MKLAKNVTFIYRTTNACIILFPKLELENKLQEIGAEGLIIFKVLLNEFVAGFVQDSCRSI
jgi:hypothetical protein